MSLREQTERRLESGWVPCPSTQLLPYERRKREKAYYGCQLEPSHQLMGVNADMYDLPEK